jgi:hypothetical protein
MIKVETTVFPEPGATLTHTTHFDDVEWDDYIDEELIQHMLWADSALGFEDVPNDITMVSMAGDYVLFEEVGGLIGGIVGVIKVYHSPDHVDMCPGGDGYGC